MAGVVGVVVFIGAMVVKGDAIAGVVELVAVVVHDIVKVLVGVQGRKPNPAARVEDFRLDDFASVPFGSGVCVDGSAVAAEDGKRYGAGGAATIRGLDNGADAVQIVPALENHPGPQKVLGVFVEFHW